MQFGIVNTTHSEPIRSKINTVNIELTDLESNFEMLKEKDKVFVMCRRGNDSKVATQTLIDCKVSHPINIEGGIDAIRSDLDPSLPIY